MLDLVLSEVDFYSIYKDNVLDGTQLLSNQKECS